MTAFDASDLTAVNQTALLVALQRATESSRPDALFHDEFAEEVSALLRESSMSDDFWQAVREMATLSGDAVALRTRHFDERIAVAVRNGVRQIVVLGVGLDGRSHRLNVHVDTRFFEVDQPAALLARQELLDAAGLEPKYRTRTIAADVTAADLQEELRAEGFDPRSPAVFVAEGLVFYLASEDLGRLLADISSLAAPGSVLLADYPAASPLNVREDTGDTVVTATFDREAKNDPWDLFGAEHWTVRCRTLTDLATTYGRTLPEEIDEARGGARWWYVSAMRS